MTSGDQVNTLFEEIDQLPCGPAERALIDRAIAISDEAGDTASGYRARLRLIQSANVTGDTDALLSSFAWCVGMNEADPHAHPLQVENLDLLWYYKWIPSTLAANPLFPREDISAALDAMQTSYERAGVGTSGVVQARFDEALESGRFAEAEEYRALLKRTPRDDYSHCDACVRSEESAYLFATDRSEEGLELFDEIVDEGLSCGEEPERAMSTALLPLLRAGRIDDARSMHLRSYRLAKGNAANLGIIANHWVFCAVSGNEARGLTLLERHIGWLAHDGLDRAAHVTALIAVGVVADAIARAGHGDLEVRGADDPRLVPFFGAHDGAWSVEDLARSAWSAAAALAAEFDARNGTDAFARRIERARALADERHPVEIDGRGFAPAVSELPSTLADASLRTVPTTPIGWARRARERAAAADADGAHAAIDAGLRLASTPAQRATLLGIGIQVLARAEGNDEEIVALIAERGEALREDDRRDQAEAEERFGSSLFGRGSIEELDAFRDAVAGARDDALRADLAVTAAELLLAARRPAEAIDLLRESFAAAREAGAVRLENHALTGLGYANLVNGELDAALAAFDAVLEREGAMESPDSGSGLHAGLAADAADAGAYADAAAAADVSDADAAAGAHADDHGAAEQEEALLDDGERYSVHGYRARARGFAGRYDEAIADAGAALDAASRLGSRALTIDAGTLLATILADAQRPADAVARLRLVIREAELAEHPGVAALRRSLGRELVRAGRFVEAVDELEELWETEESGSADPSVLGEIGYWLGHALVAIEEPGRGSWVWARTVEHLDTAGLAGLAVQTGLARGELLARYEDEEAVEVLEHALATARTVEDAGLVLPTLHALGRVLCAGGDETGLDHLDEAISIGTRIDATWFVADATDSKARCLAQLGRLDEAVLTGLQAADGYAAAGDVGSAGRTEVVVGRLLVDAGRHDDAISVLHSAVARLQDDRESLAVARLALGDALEALGRHDEAEAVRAELG